MRTLSVAVIVLLGALAWLLFRGGGQDDPVPVALERTATDPERSSAPEPDPAVTPMRVDIEEPPREEPSDPSPLRAGDPEPARPDSKTKSKAPTIPVDGIVIVVDSKGIHHSAQDGSFRPLFWGGDSGNNIASVPVTGGRFHLDCPQKCQIDIRHLVLGGQAARVEEMPFPGFEVHAGVPLTVHARWIDTVRLRVVDAASRVDLQEITIVHAADWLTDEYIHPGDPKPEDIVVEHGRSPLDVAPPETGDGAKDRAIFWVGAAGHAWSRAEIDFAMERERTLELEAAATLIVDLQGELPQRAPPPPTLTELAGQLFGGEPRERPEKVRERTPTLRLRKPAEQRNFDDVVEEALGEYDAASGSDFPGGVKPSLEEFKRMLEGYRSEFEMETEKGGELLVERPAALGESRFDGMVAGELMITVEIGDRRSPLIAGRVAATLVGGQTTRVSLTLAPQAAPPEPVPLSGVLFVPAGWLTAAVSLVIEPEDLRGKTSSDERRLRLREMTKLPGRPGWYRWDAGVVLPATYCFRIPKAGFSMTMPVAPPGLENVELRLPEAGQLAIHIVDEESGASVEFDWVEWQPMDERSFDPRASSVSLERNDDRSCYSGAVPVGRGVVELNDENWVLTDEAAVQEIHPGNQELTIRVRHACGVILEFKCDGAASPPSAEVMFACKIEAVGHEGRGASTWYSDGSGPHLQVNRPGLYRITIPAIPGFATQDPVEIEIPAARFVTHTVELRRN